MIKREEYQVVAETVLGAFDAPGILKTFAVGRTRAELDVVHTAPEFHGGIVMASTIGLSEYSSGIPYKEKPFRFEIIGMVYAANGLHERLPKLLADCAGLLVDSAVTIGPGAFFTNVIGHTRSRMQHVFLVPQLSFQNLLPIDFPEKEVCWLMAVPISERERRYALKHGVDALYHLMAEHDVQIHDWKRKPVV